ncbi:dihydrofolate reductase family protein [Ignavibacteriales bacterium]
MRKIIVIEFISLDGVLQGPGGPEEDTSGGFKYGGWTFPYFDEFSGAVMEEQTKVPSDLLLGRKTYDIFASYWPEHGEGWPGVNEARKYVVSHKDFTPRWENTVLLNENAVEMLQKLKSEGGNDLKVWGSGNLCQTLFKHDLVDEMWLKIFPVTLGSGKRLFSEGTIPAAFKMTDNKVSPSGVIFVNYSREGELKTGSF